MTILAKQSRIGNMTANVIPVLIALATLIAIVTVTINAPKRPIWDEGTYIKSLSLIEEHGFSVAFFESIPGAAGPTINFVHALAKPITGYQFPAIRLVNVTLLVLLTGLLLIAVRTAWPQLLATDAFVFGMAFLAMPYVAVSAGLVMTEMPAMLFMTGFVATLLSIKNILQFNRLWLLLAIPAAGICLALSILGRQNYLILAFLLPFMLFDVRRRNSRFVLSYAGILALACLLVVPVFLIWGGLIPKRTAWVGEGINLRFAVVAFSYLAIPAILLAPHWMFDFSKREDRIVVALSASTAMLLTFVFNVHEVQMLLPFRSLIVTVLHDHWLAPFSLAMQSVIYFVGVVLFFRVAKEFFRSGIDPEVRYLILVLLAGTASQMKITSQFSSRYILMYLPLLLIVLAPHLRKGMAFNVGLIIGSTLSVSALINYVRV